MSNKQLRVLFLVLAILTLGSLLLAACSRPGTSTGGPSNTGSGSSSPSASSGGSGGSSGSGSCPGGDTVKTNVQNFEQPCITITKGGSLKVVQDVSSFHILANGQWVNGSAQPGTQAGAPTVSNVQLSGASVSIGPFTTAGTFHIYCTVHPGMNLTVDVK